jgi:hypothetical protein
MTVGSKCRRILGIAAASIVLRQGACSVKALRALLFSASRRGRRDPPSCPGGLLAGCRPGFSAGQPGGNRVNFSP